jgi:hypothetical protein
MNLPLRLLCIVPVVFATTTFARDDKNKPAESTPAKQPAEQPADAKPTDKADKGTKETGDKKAKPKTPPKVKAAAIAGAASRMATNMKCSGCHGDGKVPIITPKVPKGKGVGGKTAPASIQPMQGTRGTDKCDGCDGAGLRKGDLVWNTATNFVSDLAQLDLTDKEWASRRKDATGNGLQEAAQLGLDRLARKLNERAIDTLFSAGAEPAKQAVALVGVYAKGPEIGSGDVIVDTSRGYLMLRAPIITRCLPLERVLTGGVWTGMTEVKVYYLDEQGNQQEKSVPARVLEHAFVVAP